MTSPNPPSLRIGHVHLRVSDLDRSIAFYRDVIGLQVMQHIGAHVAFLSSDGYHHHIGLNTWDSKGGTPPPRGHSGLYHTAFVYPDRPALARAYKRVIDAGVEVYGAADHGVSQALYFDDPDRNGIEIYWDRDPSEWPWQADKSLKMVNEPLDRAALLAEA